MRLVRLVLALWLSRLLFAALVGGTAATQLGSCDLGELGDALGGLGRSRQTSAELARVIDGDTIVVRAGTAERRVRLIGYDSPEATSSVECGGRAGTRSLRRLARPGQRVRLLADPTQPRRDRYGRLLRYVERDGVDLGLAQVRRGYGRPLVVGQPPERHARYVRAAERARAAGRGAWGRCGSP